MGRTLRQADVKPKHFEVKLVNEALAELVLRIATTR
jgi:hypothetical protein